MKFKKVSTSINDTIASYACACSCSCSCSCGCNGNEDNRYSNDYNLEKAIGSSPFETGKTSISRN